MPVLLRPSGKIAVQAGRFRHRVTIQRRTTGRDDAGGIVDTWTDHLTGVPAIIEPASGQEYFIARQIASTMDTSITIRWRPGIDETMRVLHGTDTFDINSVLPDSDTGRETLSLICTKRGAEGFRSGS